MNTSRNTARAEFIKSANNFQRNSARKGNMTMRKRKSNSIEKPHSNTTKKQHSTQCNIEPNKALKVKILNHSTDDNKEKTIEVDIIKELYNIKEQQEGDKKLFDKVIKEQRGKIKKLETVLTSLKDVNLKLKQGKHELTNENTTLKTKLKEVEERVKALNIKCNELNNELVVLRKEKTNLQKLSQYTNTRLCETTSILRSLITTYIKSLSFIFNSQCHTNIPELSTYSKLFKELKGTLIKKLKVLTSAVSIDTSTEIRLVL